MDSRTNPTNTAAGTDRRRWVALALLCVATFIIILDGTIVFVAIPSIAQDLKLGPSGVQWVLSSYLLSFGGLLLLGGRLADLLGRRRMFMLGGTLLAVASLLCGLASSGDTLITFRVLQGLAAAIMTPTALSIITNTFKEGPDRNKALGAWSSAGGIGGTVGALIGGPLTDGPGWEWIFFVNVPVALVMVLLTPVVLRESYDRGRARTYDVAGALTSSAALVMVVYAIVDAPSAGWDSGQTIGLFAGAAALLALFVVAESRSAAPLVPLRMFRSKALVGGNLVLLSVGMSVHAAMGFLLTQYAQIVLGYSAVEFGWMFAGMTVLTIVGSTLAGGPLVNRFGPRPVAAVSLLTLVASCLILTQISVGGSYVDDMMVGMLLFGPGLGAGFTAAAIASLAGVAEQDAGLASGLNNASFHIGGALGIAIVSTVAVSHASGPNPLAALTEGFQAAFVAATIFPAIGVVAALVLLGRSRALRLAGASGQPGSPSSSAAKRNRAA
jgi:EmrB/QacA subfamily drug resistance transporter